MLRLERQSPLGGKGWPDPGCSRDPQKAQEAMGFAEGGLLPSCSSEHVEARTEPERASVIDTPETQPCSVPVRVAILIAMRRLRAAGWGVRLVLGNRHETIQCARRGQHMALYVRNGTVAASAVEALEASACSGRPA